jgi:hypothetical protein
MPIDEFIILQRVGSMPTLGGGGGQSARTDEKIRRNT